MLDEAWQTKDQLTITVKVNYLPEVVEFLYYQQGGWLSVLFGNDERKLNGHYAVYYVLSMEQGTKCWITVRGSGRQQTGIPVGDAARPGGGMGEREVRDMYGLVPVGLPDERRLVCRTTGGRTLSAAQKTAWIIASVRRQPPTPKPTSLLTSSAARKTTWCRLARCTSPLMNLATSRLFVDGENIIDADYRLFYVHRGMEKLAETRMGYNEVTFLSDRVCGICGFAHSTAYTTSVENAMGIVVRSGRR